MVVYSSYINWSANSWMKRRVRENLMTEEGLEGATCDWGEWGGRGAIKVAWGGCGGDGGGGGGPEPV